MTFVELCAGSAAVSLRLLSSRARSPLGYQGSKRGYANAILQAMGLAPGQGGREGWEILLVEPGPWGEAWQLWRTAEGRRDTCERLRAWAGEDPRQLWERLRSVPVPVDAAERVATWAVLQLWSFARRPVASTAGRWVEHGFNSAGAYPDRHKGFYSDGYAIDLPYLLEQLAALPALSRVQVHQGCATDIPPLDSAHVYIDPPYQNTSGYGHDLARADVLALAERWRLAGSHVAVSEAEPLPLPGWHTHRLPRAYGVVRSWSAQQSEYLTLSREPRGQLALIGGAA